MSSIRISVAIAGLAAIVSRSPAAIAQPIVTPAQAPVAPAPATTIELGVEVDATPDQIDAAAVRAAIADELGIAVADDTAFAPVLGRLTITIEGRGVRIGYQPASGTLVERTLALPPAPDDRVQLVAYVATNLVRDQANEILAGLPAASVPGAPGASVVRTPPTPRDPSIERTPIELVAPRHLAATIGFVPPISVDRLLGAHVVVGVGIHALAGFTEGSEVISMSGLVDMQRTFAVGAQLGGLAAVTRGELDGIQLAGIAAISGHTMRGVQVAGIATVAARVEGVQIAGIATVADEVDGMQIGLVNIARRVHGVQLGLINLSDDGDDSYPIGLISYSRNGMLAVDAYAESSRLFALALRHGTRHVHNVWGVAWSPDSARTLVGVGLGLHHALAAGPSAASIDVDAMNWWVDIWNGNLEQLDQLRATLAVPLGPIDVIAGAVANAYVSRGSDHSADFHPTIDRNYTDGDIHVTVWPSAFVGVRLPLH